MSKLNVPDKFVGNSVKERSRVHTVLVEGASKTKLLGDMHARLPFSCQSARDSVLFAGVCDEKVGSLSVICEAYRGDVAKT